MRPFSPERLGGDERFKVTWVCEGNMGRVLAMELVDLDNKGHSQEDDTCVKEDAILRLPQANRNDVRDTPPP